MLERLYDDEFINIFCRILNKDPHVAFTKERDYEGQYVISKLLTKSSISIFGEDLILSSNEKQKRNIIAKIDEKISEESFKRLLNLMNQHNFSTEMFCSWEEGFKYFTDEENLHTTLFKPYLYAIFGDKDLAMLAVFDTIEKIYDMKGEIFEENVLNNEGKDDDDSHFLDDEEDVEWISLGNEDENIFTSWNEEEFAFYLKFIDNINRILITYGKNDDLLNTKYRLLFILDKEELCLFDEVNFYTTLDRVLEFDFHDEAFDFFEKEAKFFIEEVFNNNVRYDYTIKKLLFIRTYYELTGDKEIIDVFNKYKNCDSYNEFYNIVFDKNSYIRKRRF